MASASGASVPEAAANYTPATLDPELRSAINGHLLNDGLVSKIEEHLLHSLHAHPANWPTLVENHALSLLRSGECTTFPALIRRVIEDVRHDTALAPSSSVINGTSTEVNGRKGANGTTAAGAASTNGASSSTTTLAVPYTVVEDALKLTRECLDTVCYIEPAQ